MMLGMELDDVELIEAARASEGFDLANSDDPDAMVIDLRLPDGDGLDLVRRVRQQDGLRQIPIVVLTAGYDPANEVAALTAGADAYLPKPFEPKDVEARLESILQLAPSQRRGRRRHIVAGLRRDQSAAAAALLEPRDDVKIELVADIVAEAAPVVTSGPRRWWGERAQPRSASR
jgi:DNA-binding response OmpR family regulator